MHAMVENVYETRAPNGSPVCIPAVVDERDDVYRDLQTDAQIKAYYRANGYVVVRGLIPRELCGEVLESFEKEVKPYSGYIYRQATANPEKHVFTDHGYVRNSILNVQDLNSSLFPEFKRMGLAAITHERLQRKAAVLLGEPGKLVQSMFFEGNSATWPHQDTYYLDSERLGAMTGAWIAVEDIAPGAGRFFVYPGSHKIDMDKNGGNFDIAFNHDRYKKLVVDIIDAHALPIHAPALSAGDVLFWSAKTIHGSLETTQPERSRASLTAHLIPGSHRFMQFQTRVKPLRLSPVNGMQVHQPKPQDRLMNRIVLGLETRFPRAYQTAKKLAVKAVTR